MAVFTVSLLGGDINAGTTYVGGIAPTSADTIAFTATSGQLTVNTIFTIAGIDFTSYVNTLTFSANLTVNGNITLSTGMSFAGSNTFGFICLSNCSLTSNGKTFPHTLSLSGTTITYTFVDDWTVTNFINSNPHTLTGFSVNVTGNLTTAQRVQGTTVINLTGTGIWSGAGNIDMLVNINTPGTITVSGTVAVAKLTYITGTVNTTGSTLSVNTSTSTNTWDISSITWNNVTCSLGTLNLTSELNLSGTLTLASSNVVTITTSNINCSGSIVMSNQTVSGSITINLTGTGTWSGSGQLKTNLNINTSGTITVSGNVAFNTGILTYTSGTVITTGSTLNIGGATTLNTSGMTWNNVTTTLSITITLTSILIVEGTLSIAGSSFATSACHVKGNLTITGNTGTAGTIIINGTGNQTWSGVNRVRTNLQINKPSGTLTISGSVAFTNSTLTYIAGNVDTTGSTLTIDVASTIDTNDLFWNNISLSGGTQTLLSDINCQNLTSAGNIINGLFNVNVGGNLTANGVVQGTSTIVINGTGTWTALNGSNTFRIPIIINTNGIITLANTLYQGCSLTYIKGTVKSNNTTITFGVDLATTLINLHKLIFKNVLLGASKTITMNEFFSGSPSLVTNVNPTSGSNYTIAFQDGFEKISKFVNISGCTLLKPLQLLVITNSQKNSNNRGIRYINQSPNGIAKGVPSINAPMTFGVAGLLSDPNM